MIFPGFKKSLPLQKTWNKNLGESGNYFPYRVLKRGVSKGRG